MKILFIADGRSPTALNWINFFVDRGHQVHLVSTFPASSDLSLVSLHILPVAFSGETGQHGEGTGRSANFLRKITTPAIRTQIRQVLGGFTLRRAADQLAKIIADTKPDLSHAMRIPFEGMLAVQAVNKLSNRPPLLISVWGNDFTLHAPSNPMMGRLTRRTLDSATALHADCQRDLRLAVKWGFDTAKLSFVLPGGGGIQPGIFHPNEELAPANTVINPRGFRAYIRNDTFFKAIPLILSQAPDTKFICPAMAGEAEAERWVKTLGIQDAVELLPRIPRSEMANQFRRAGIVVSPSTHDGTPNTLLEAMACGCFPIAGDIESLREWIKDGDNGFLFNPDDPSGLADAILRGQNQPDRRRWARAKNLTSIEQSAVYGSVMQKAEKYYMRIINSPQK